MADGIATKKNPKKWAQAKARAKAKMGGKHSARAMQLATKYYKDSGGGYEGKKPSAKNNKMKKWTEGKEVSAIGEPSTSVPGKNSTEGKGATGERYLPKKKRDAMSDAQKELIQTLTTSDPKKRVFNLLKSPDTDEMVAC